MRQIRDISQVMELVYLVSLFLLCFWTSETVANGSNGQTVSKCVTSKPVFHIFPTSHCLMCPLNAIIGRCPSGTVKITAGMGLRQCILGSNIYGCVHLCRRKAYKSVCCEDHWGPDCQCKYKFILNTHTYTHILKIVNSLCNMLCNYVNSSFMFG